MTLFLFTFGIFIALLFLIKILYKSPKKKHMKKSHLYLLFFISLGAIVFLVISEFNTNGLTDKKIWLILPLLITCPIALIVQARKS